MPLSGIRVVELTQYVLGPMAGALLSDWGAEVIKIEDPAGGDSFRGLLASGVVEQTDINLIFEGCNYNKRSICLDLKKEKGRELAYELVKGADVFVTNMRTKTLQKLGMDYESLHRIAPRLIYAIGTGYGLKGPDNEKPGMDTTAYWARSGFMSILGEPGDVPGPLRGSIGDRPTAAFLVCGILLALLQRQRTGEGQMVHNYLTGSGVWVNGDDATAAMYTGRDIPRISRKDRRNPLYNIYKTKDQRWINLCVMQSDRYWPSLCRAIDREDLIDDPRFNSHEKRSENNVNLISILDEAVAAKTVGELAPVLDEEDFPWELCRTMIEVANDPQIRENDSIMEIVDHPALNEPLKLVGFPVKLSNRPKQPPSPAPVLGQHTEEILLELGYDWDKISELKDTQIIP